VLYILQNVSRAFPDARCFVLSLSGEFVPVAEAQKKPLEFAASNWLATASYLSKHYQNCILVDVGSTTTDIIPIVAGQVKNLGRTDLERLKTGELVYTGILRTHLASIVHSVPVEGQYCRVSAEYFAISGDVHLILGNIRPEDYTCPTPDGRPPTIDQARGRLARLVCADTEMLSPAAIDSMAKYIYQQQLQQIRQALQQVLSRMPDFHKLPVLALGAGAFLAEKVAQEIGLPVTELAAPWERQAAHVAPSLAAAYLLATHLELL